jgi:hypothetical protein
MRACEVEMHETRSGTPDYHRKFRANAREPNWMTQLEQYLAIQQPYKEFEALLVYGYCQKNGDPGLSLRRLNHLAPAIELMHRRGSLRQAAPAAQYPTRNEWFASWYGAMRARVRTLRDRPGAANVNRLEERSRVALEEVEKSLQRAKISSSQRRAFLAFTKKSSRLTKISPRTPKS